MTLPTKAELLDFIKAIREPVSKRDLATAFRIKGDDRRPFKALLSQLESEGLIVRQPSQRYSVPDGLPAVAMIEVIGVDVDGDLFAKPLEWDENLQGKPARIEVMPDKKGHPALKEGDRALARLRRTDDSHIYEAAIIKRADEVSNQVIGMVVAEQRGFKLRPSDRKIRADFEISQADLNGAEDGDLVVADIMPSRGLRHKKVRVKSVLGHESDPKAISLIAMAEAGLKAEFPPEVIREAEKMGVPALEKRTDLRDLPLVTIDGPDARDFDDAVHAEDDSDPSNPGGYALTVAIADVAYYVRHGTRLDKEAWTRGNSTYFPDRVVPMLPENLSNNLCSLMPKVERACLAVRMRIDKHGKLLDYKFMRGLMKSVARLTYEQVQAAYDGQTDDLTDLLMDHVIRPLYKAYKILDAARIERGALELDLPERKILVDEEGNMTGVKVRARLDSHKLIEEFMILANVAAASALEDKKSPCVYRIHDRPSADKLEGARGFLETFGFSLPVAVAEPKQINHLLLKAKDHPYSNLISMMVLRTQAQARYDPDNIGHFGLALHKYAHFTSPIRRYADLIVHRSLIRAYNLGPGGLEDEDAQRIVETSEHISATERVSSEAERSSVDRFTASYLESQIGAEFDGVINGVTRFGLFVTLNETGADGLVPMRSLRNDYYTHDEEQHALIGQRTKTVFRLGAPVTVKIAEAERISGSTVFEMVNPQKGADIPGFTLKKPLKNNEKTSYKKNRGAGKYTKNTGKTSGRNEKKPFKNKGYKKK